MDFDLNLTVDNLVKEEVKKERITFWDNLFQKYERISKESTNIINVEHIEEAYGKGNDTDLNFLKSGIVKKKRSRPRPNKVNPKIKRTKVLKLDDNLKCVVNNVSSASDVGLNCISAELVPEVTHINTIEELKSHEELVVNLTNHNIFKFSSESDSSGEILMEDDSPVCDFTDGTNLLNVQDNIITDLMSRNVKQIQVMEIDEPQTDYSVLKKSYEMEKLEDKSEDQNYHCKDLVSEWLNKTEPFQKYVPSKHDNVVYFKEPVVAPSVKFPVNNILFDLDTRSNHCNSKCMSQDTVNELFPKRISTRSKRLKCCETCNDHKSPIKVDISFKQEDVETPTILLSNPDSSSNSFSLNRRNISKKMKLEDLSNEASCSGESLQDLNVEESLYKKDKCRHANVYIPSKEMEICYSKQESGENPRINETYNLKSDFNISSIKNSKEEGLLNLEIKSDDLSAKHKSDNNSLQNFLMTKMFYKRNKCSKNYPSSSKIVNINSTEQNNLEPMVNCLKKLKSESNTSSSAKILKEGHFKNLVHEGHHRIDDHGLVNNNKGTLTAKSLNSFGQPDENFQSSSSRMNSILSMSRASITSTPIKDKEKSPKQNKDEENYLKIKNKIENELKSNLGFMAYKRHKLHQNSDASNKEETEFWEKSVRKEIKKLSGVIPSVLLLRYMKEYINLRINSSG